MKDKYNERGNEVKTHKEVNTKDLVYRGVSTDTQYFSLAKARARQGKHPLYYRGVIYTTWPASHETAKLVWVEPWVQQQT